MKKFWKVVTLGITIIIFQCKIALTQSNTKSDSLLSKGQKHLKNGRFSEARMLYKKALISLRENNNKDTLQALIGIGQTYLFEFNTQNALEIFKKCKRTIERNQFDKKISSSFFNNLSICFNIIGKKDSSLFYNNRAILFTSKKDELRGDYFETRAVIFNRLGNKDFARHYHKISLRIFKNKFGVKHLKIARGYYNLSSLFWGDNSDSTLKYTRLSIESNCPEYKFSSQNPIPNTKHKVFSKVILIASLLRQGQLLSGGVATKRNALLTLMVADSISIDYQKSLTRRVEQISLLRNTGKILEQSLLLLYELYNQPNIPPEQKQRYLSLFTHFAERSRANVLINEINKSRIYSPIELLGLKGIQDKLTANETVVEYVQAGNFLLSIIIGKKKTALVRVAKITRKSLRKMALRYYASCQSSNLYRYQKYAPIIYEKIFKPIAPFVPKNHHLLIIASEELSSISFDAMLTSSYKIGPSNAIDKTPLLLKKQASINYYPSLTLILQRRNITRSYKNEFVGVAHTWFNKLDSLYYSKDELSKAAGNFEESAQVFFNEEGNREVIKRVNARILHLSTHGWYDNSKEEMLNGLYLKTKDGKEDIVKSSELYQINIKADLVVLSACFSGSAVIAQYEGELGFPRALIFSGVRNIITSIYSASEEPTRDFFTVFYQQVKAGDSYRVAFTKAKLSTLKKHKLPTFWSGFLFIGF